MKDHQTLQIPFITSQPSKPEETQGKIVAVQHPYPARVFAAPALLLPLGLGCSQRRKTTQGP